MIDLSQVIWEAVPRRGVTRWRPEDIGEEITGLFAGFAEHSNKGGETYRGAVFAVGCGDAVKYVEITGAVVSRACAALSAGTPVRIVYRGERDVGRECPLRMFDVYTPKVG